MKQFITVAFVLFVLVENTLSWDQGGVLLRDVQVLTLYKDRYTAARRSSPVPQLKCVGGSAGCHAFIPDVVQCQNRGWDGVDVQWECKTDMDAAFRFGRLEVSCEGFTQPDDAFILPGSCGLEFTLELTAEGRRTTQGSSGGFKGFGDLGGFASSFFSGFQGNKHNQHHHHNQGGQSSGSEDSSGLLVPAVLLVLAFVVYKLFLSGNTAQAGQQGGQEGYHDNQQGFNTGPPPPGFRPDFTGSPGGNPSYGFHSDYTQGPHYPGGRPAPAGTGGLGGGGGGGGFWSGMGTGGLLGYLFGNQRNQPHNYNYPRYNNSRAPPAGPSPPSSSGTRTASGFGGTKRR
ncbi:store-operated calcium entry-associated regulatory factor [Labrus bergylta]|uniref:store-operated calcium entry-associated regulatory factor n=1 Tax=Labrus bergylta TaxID=56723 RepID=UPI0033142F39